MEIGQKVVFYPDYPDHRNHNLVTVVAITPKRVRIRFEDNGHTLLCHPNKIIDNQIELINEL